MDDIIEYLCRIYFTKLEAQIYVNLLQNQGLTGYQIAKNLNVSRSSVYPALENMYKNGVVLLVKGDAVSYIAENPSVLLGKLKKNFEDNANILEQKLAKINSSSSEERFVNIQGESSIIAKAKDLILKAEKEIIMNIDGDIHIFDDEIKEANKKGVRVIVFSFADLNTDGLDVESYFHQNFVANGLFPNRIMLVVDNITTLVADNNKKRKNSIGTITDNELMVSIITEHIIHDIYMLLYRRAYPDHNISKEFFLDTLLEHKRKYKR